MWESQKAIWAFQLEGNIRGQEDPRAYQLKAGGTPLMVSVGYKQSTAV